VTRAYGTSFFVKGVARENRPLSGGNIMVSRKKIVRGKRKVVGEIVREMMNG